MKGFVSEEALAEYSRLAAEKLDLDFAEGEVYDFARCMRADGSFYGTRGTCKKGTAAGDAPADKPKKLKTDFRKDVKKGAEKRKAREAKTAERQEMDVKLRKGIQEKLASQKPLKVEMNRIESNLKMAARQLKKDPTPEKRAEVKKLMRDLREKEREYNKGEKELEKMGRARIRIEEQKQRERMTPAQRAEARRIDKIIKERG
jgi:hypothetical protein